MVLLHCKDQICSAQLMIIFQSYSLRPEILVLQMVLSRLVLVIDTSILSISRISISGGGSNIH